MRRSPPPLAANRRRDAPRRVGAALGARRREPGVRGNALRARRVRRLSPRRQCAPRQRRAHARRGVARRRRHRAHNDGDAKDELWVHDVRLLSGGLAPSLAVPVRVSLNGQQFEPADAASAATLTMLAPPLLSAVAPPVGPRDGGTRVVVSGANLHGGSAPRCRFGALAPVVATEDAGGGLRCEAPPSAAAGDGTVAVSLNGAQFAPATAAFAYLGATAVDASPRRTARGGRHKPRAAHARGARRLVLRLPLLRRGPTRSTSTRRSA